jgi:hypothetical protein
VSTGKAAGPELRANFVIMLLGTYGTINEKGVKQLKKGSSPYLPNLLNSE